MNLFLDLPEEAREIYDQHWQWLDREEKAIRKKAEEWGYDDLPPERTDHHHLSACAMRKEYRRIGDLWVRKLPEERENPIRRDDERRFAGLAVRHPERLEQIERRKAESREKASRLAEHMASIYQRAVENATEAGSLTPEIDAWGFMSRRYKEVEGIWVSAEDFESDRLIQALRKRVGYPELQECGHE